MNRLWVRLGFVIIILAVVFTSGYRLLHSERQRNIEYDAASTYDALAWTLTVVLVDLRSAQQAYVAGGQDPDEWFTQAASQLGRLKDGLANLRAISKSSEAVEAVAAAAALVERLGRVGESARNHTAIGQVLMASDLVFTDGKELTRQAAEQLERARVAEAEARLRRRGEIRADDVMTAAVAAIVIIGVTFVLLPRHGTLSAAVERPADPIEPLVPADVALVSAEWEVKRAGGVDAGPVPTVAALEGDGESTPDLEASDPPSVVPDLTATAQLCTDLGRVSASDDLDDLLGRAGDLLNASGLIVWVRDSSGRALRPATGHGYAPQILARLGRVACDGESATATAYRTARLQVVSGGERGRGALAVPLVSSAADTGRCVGVLSAEMRHGWEANDGVQATATILAAQLATVVTADPVCIELEARA